MSGEATSWHCCCHLNIFLLCIFLLFFLALLNDADLPHPVEVPLDAWHSGRLRRWGLLGGLRHLIRRQEGIQGSSRQTLARADVQVLGRLLSPFPLPVSFGFPCSVMPLSSQLSLRQEEVSCRHMVVLIAVEAVNDGLPGGNAARDHLLDDVRMVLLGQVLPGHQRQHIPQRH